MFLEASTHSSSPIPWRIRLLASAVTTITDASIRRDGTVNRGFFSFFDRKAPANPTVIDGVSSSDHAIDPSRSLWARLFSPSLVSNTKPLPVIVYFHGGGFCFHSAATRSYDALCRRLAGHIPAFVLSVEYRLSPEHKCPKQYEDGIDAIKWLDASHDLFPDVSAVFLAGDSAGGNIAHHVMQRLIFPPDNAEQSKRVKLAGLVAIQPFFGGEVQTKSERRLDSAPFGSYERFKWMWHAFLPVGSDRDHEAANVFGPDHNQYRSSEDWTRFPPTMIFIGGQDALQDRQRNYVEGLKRVGVMTRLEEYPDAIHGFFIFPDLPDAKKMLDDMGDFAKAQINRIKHGSNSTI